MDERTNVSASLDHQPNNGNGHRLEHPDRPYQSAYEAGRISGREEGYRLGYREGFFDGWKLVNPASGATAAQDAPTAASGKATGIPSPRLRGLPCANCGCSTYGDELQCSRCGTPTAHPAVPESTIAK